MPSPGKVLLKILSYLRLTVKRTQLNQHSEKLKPHGVLTLGTTSV